VRTFGRALALAALIACGPAAAMHFFAEPPVLHLMGRVDKSDWDIWKEAIYKYEGKIDTVVFHQSPGGDSVTGRNIGRSIRKLGWRTVVAGRCMSACANMFLGGKQRLFSSRLNEEPTVLGYHGSYDKWTGEVNKRASGEYFHIMSEGKMSPDLIDRFIQIDLRQGALYLIHPAQRKAEDDPLAFFCRGSEDSGRRDKECERMVGVDALGSGVVTSWDAAVTPPKPRMRRDVGVTWKNWD
jgi:hypothetical protein